MTTAQSTLVRVLLVGESPARLAESSNLAQLITVSDLPTARQWLADTDTPPLLVVLFPARPGQFSQADVESLRALAPLTRVWRVLGPWCEGEPRSGRPPAGCTSLYWHQWPARLERELLAMGDGQLPEWSQPLTASSEERTLLLTERPLPPAAGPGPKVVGIAAPHAASATALADVARLCGYEAHILSAHGAQQPLRDAAAVLWDAHADELHDEQAVAKVKGLAPSAALIALVTFPRPDDVLRATDLGVSAVVAKPYLVADLVGALVANRPASAT